jgi:GT2 family glycosyltransferase
MPNTEHPLPDALSMVIGVCTYNRGAAIERTLRALAEMDPVVRDGVPRLRRIVIVNNRSTDDTAAVVDRFIAGNSGPVPMEQVHEQTPGKTQAMLRLFAATDEPVVCIIDDDTTPERGWAGAMLSLLEAQPRAGVVGGPVVNVWESGPTELAIKYRRSLGDQLMGEARVKLTDPGGFLMGASLAIRRRALEESGWLEGSRLESRKGESLECGAEDAELCIRIRQAGWEVWYEPAAKMGHLIPARRQTVEYLARLRGAICRGEPALKWVAGQVESMDKVRAEAKRARRLYFKTALFSWSPGRRRIRLAERRGKMEGWRQLAERLEAESS